MGKVSNVIVPSVSTIAGRRFDVDPEGETDTPNVLRKTAIALPLAFDETVTFAAEFDVAPTAETSDALMISN